MPTIIKPEDCKQLVFQYHLSDLTTPNAKGVKPILSHEEKYKPAGAVLHWSAGAYKTLWDDYHINITFETDIYTLMNELRKAPDKQKSDLLICNVYQTGFAEKKLPHTWNRNSGQLGISICAMNSAIFIDNLILPPGTNIIQNMLVKKNHASYPPFAYGASPVMWVQLDCLALICAQITRQYGWTFNPVDSKVIYDTYQRRDRGISIYCIMSHAEWALIDGYGPYSGDPQTRWDLFWETKWLRKRMIEWYGITKPQGEENG